MAEVKWWDGEGLPAPQVRQRQVPVVWPGPGERLRVIALAEDLAAVQTHWWGECTLPCAGPGCVACAAQASARLLVYLGCYHVSWARPVLICLSESAAAEVLAAVSDTLPLRGRWLTLRRAGRGTRSRVVCEVDALSYDGRLPEAPKVRTVLLRLWGGRERLLRPDCMQASADCRPDAVVPFARKGVAGG